MAGIPKPSLAACGWWYVVRVAYITNEITVLVLLARVGYQWAVVDIVQFAIIIAVGIQWIEIKTGIATE